MHRHEHSLLDSPGTVSKQHIYIHYQANFCKPFMLQTDNQLCSEELAQHKLLTDYLQTVGFSLYMA